MTTHTPGPWSIDRRESFSGRHTAYIKAGGETDDAPQLIRIANLPYTYKTAETQLANANLIAAAPQLFDALEACLQALRHTKMQGCYGEEAQRKAELALRKAEILTKRA